MSSSQTEKRKIIVYGLDVLGFDKPSEPLNISNNLTIRFCDFFEALSLDEFDGVIIPQGIFEKIEPQYGYEPYTEVKVERNLLLEREREIFNLIKGDNWICFLVGEVIDQVPQGYRTSSIKSTDLCKRVLNLFDIRRKSSGGIAFLETKSNEFLTFVRKYGVAKTVFDFIQRGSDKKVLVTAPSKAVVGFEIYGKIFFLPFHTTKTDSSTVTNFSKTLTKAIIDYRQKNKILLPSWLDSFQFEAEKSLNERMDDLFKKVTDFQLELKKWREYKSILTVSGNLLRDKIILILQEFFGLKVDPIDEGREDAKIVDENSSPIFIIEVKGTKKGIKREHINQVDSHRERNDLNESTPGVLFINNEMSMIGIENRLKTTVPEEHIKHAKRLNVLIVRTIDLICLMRHLERSTLNKQEVLAGLLNSGGGWLNADFNEYKIVNFD